MFVKNCWYVAAWSTEVTSTPMARTLLGESVVLYRTASGTVAALENRCPHRGVPLSVGRVDGDILRCGYHGLEFDTKGACVRVPGQDIVPRACKVSSYILVEKDAVVWIWMGDPTLANPDEIVSYPWHSSPEWRWKGTTYHVECNYQFLNDNLLDLTHLGYVHLGTIGGDPNSHSNAEMKTTRTGREVHVERWMRDVKSPPTFVKGARLEGQIDRWQEITFRPGMIDIWAGGVPAGSEQGKREGSYGSRIFNGLTPETGQTSHYFWSAAHTHRTDEPNVTELHFSHIAAAFEEDRVILGLQQQNRNKDRTRPMVDIKSDVAGLHARRIIQEMLALEHPPG
jgi:phenylpropionate dioxygenase-like ring-hydroxylating dioxygenase large terminal subunit